MAWPRGSAGWECISLSKIWKRLGRGQSRAMGRRAARTQASSCQGQYQAEKGLPRVSFGQALRKQGAPKNPQRFHTLGAGTMQGLPLGTLKPPSWVPPGPGSTHLSDLLDLAASFANEGPALAGGDHKPEGDRGPAGSWAVGHGAADVLRGRGGVEGSALLERHALGTCLARGQGGDAGTSGPGQGDLGAFPVPFPRTSFLSSPEKIQMYFGESSRQTLLSQWKRV